MSSVAKSVAALTVAALALCHTPVQPKPLYILVVGQAMASNCNEHLYASVPGVFQIGRDGSERPAADPLDWADCQQGSTWVPLGKKLIEAGMADRVVFMPLGVSDAKVADWQAGGRAAPKLDQAFDIIRRKGLTFDMAFWQQGDADAGSSAPRYTRNLRLALLHIATHVPIHTWLIARHSRCQGPGDPKIAQVQSIAGMNYLMNHFPGPDADLLGDAYRIDGCRLNQAGQEKMAQAWLEAMRTAQDHAPRVQKESLLHYFK